MPALSWQAALLPVGSWVVISLYSSRHLFSFPLANTQFPRTLILLPQRLCWGSVEYGRPSLAYRELTTQWSCFVLPPNHFPVPGIRIHTLQKPRSLLLGAWQALLSMCDLLVLLGVHISDVMGNKEDFAWRGRGLPPNCCFRCPSAARPRAPASSPSWGGVFPFPNKAVLLLFSHSKGINDLESSQQS